MAARPPVSVLLVALAIGCSGRAPEPPAESPTAPEWVDWSPAVFERARREDRLVLLDLGAVWCHWCHVMEETTYRDAAVLELLARGYVTVRVDQDSRPDLAGRYGEYGWPATILFDSSGHELAKWRGYIQPADMAGRLAAFLEDPTPGPSAAGPPPAPRGGASSLDAELRADLLAAHRESYDAAQGSWGTVHKFLPPRAVELAMLQGAEGDAEEERRARETLDRSLALIDPVWGGVYQYSHGGVWTNPHFEKILPFQADDLAVYSLAYARYGEARYLEAARSIARFLFRFLAGEGGAFRPSQDADVVPGEHAGDYFALDDAGRRAIGVPRIDPHLYARENGWAIAALVRYWAASSDDEALAAALRAARWVLANRSLPGGGFRHDAPGADRAGPYLGDTLSMGRAFLALYSATGDREWFDRSAEAAAFIARTFRAADGPGYAASAPHPEDVFAPALRHDENLELARWANLLAHSSGDPAHRTLAGEAMRLATDPGLARAAWPPAALLLADREVSSEPVHFVVVGPRDDPRTKALVRAALAWPVAYAHVDPVDPAGPRPLGVELEYPALDRPAAYVCGAGTCSEPVFEPEAIRATADRLAGLAR